MRKRSRTCLTSAATLGNSTRTTSSMAWAASRGRTAESTWEGGATIACMALAPCSGWMALVIKESSNKIFARAKASTPLRMGAAMPACSRRASVMALASDVTPMVASMKVYNLFFLVDVYSFPFSSCLLSSFFFCYYFLSRLFFLVPSFFLSYRFFLLVFFKGEYKDEIQHGTGVMTWPDGSRYEGHYKAGKRHGHGVMTWANGKGTYDGDWHNDLRHGRGRRVYEDGTIFEGSYVRNNPHGPGKEIFLNGSTFEGNWVEGEKHGPGRLRDADKGHQTFAEVWERGKKVSSVPCEDDDVGGMDATTTQTTEKENEKEKEKENEKEEES